MKYFMGALNTCSHTKSPWLWPHGVEAQHGRVFLFVAVCFAILVSSAHECVAGVEAISAQVADSEKSLSIGIIAAMCNSVARFPDVCVESLETRVRTVRPNILPAELAGPINEEAVLAMQRLHSQSVEARKSLLQQHAQIKAALIDCEELTERSYELLEQAQQKFEGVHASGDFILSTMDDIRTWISASLTFLTTCTDDLPLEPEPDAHVALRLREEAGRVAKVISNSLAFSSQLSAAGRFSILQWVPSRNNRRIKLAVPTAARDRTKSGWSNFPEWMSQEDVDFLAADNSKTPNVTVAADGSGEYRNVQAAVDTAPTKSSTRYVIYIKAGTYDEQVIVPKSGRNLMFLGDGIGKTIITGSRNVQQPGVTTFNSATVAVNGNGFLARDITFQNTAGPVKHQAVALRVSADHAAFYKCSMDAYQDTLYTHSLRQFYRECIVAGTVDFIFGNSAVVFQTCSIQARVPMRGQTNTITAQGRTDPNQTTGISLHNCTIDGTAELQKEWALYPTFLGRPWKEYSRTVLLRCYEGALLNPAGWLRWEGSFGLSTLFYGEYDCEGPGAGAAQRVPWSTQIQNITEAEQFSVASFISGLEWLPDTSLPFQASL